MLTTIIVIILLAIAAILGLAAMKPDVFGVRREADIAAPPEKIFALLNDFHQWALWSPWENMDPAMTRLHSGAAEGKGAIYAWEGNKKVGKGRMEILEAMPPERLAIKLDFLKPFEAHNTTIFTLDEKGGSTHVAWDMHGPAPFMVKLMHLFFNMDKMVGKDFEKGLANMKAIAETPVPSLSMAGLDPAIQPGSPAQGR